MHQLKKLETFQKNPTKQTNCTEYCQYDEVYANSSAVAVLQKFWSE